MYARLSAAARGSHLIHILVCEDVYSHEHIPLLLQHGAVSYQPLGYLAHVSQLFTDAYLLHVLYVYVCMCTGGLGREAAERAECK